MDNNLNIKLSMINPDEDSPEIIIREGKALDQVKPVALNISGIITAPAAFYRQRKGLPSKFTDAFPPGAYFDKKNTHVIVSRDSKKIQLISNENSPEADTITGTLEISKEYRELKINSGTTYTPKDLAVKLKSVRYLFESRDEAMEIVAALNKFSATVTNQVEQHQDQRGNKTSLLDTKVQTNAPLEFILQIPVFKGLLAERVKVEIVLDACSQVVECSLESIELRQMEAEQVERIIDEELKIFLADGITVIEV